MQCVDIEFSDPKDVAEVTRENCFNSSDIGFEHVFTTTSSMQSSIGVLRFGRVKALEWVTVVVMVVLGLWM